MVFKVLKYPSDLQPFTFFFVPLAGQFYLPFISMANRYDMNDSLCELTDPEWSTFLEKYGIGVAFRPTLLSPDQNIMDCHSVSIALYTRFLEFSNLRLP
jgi:hypothetical protein